MAKCFQSLENVHCTSRNEKISIHSKAGNLNWGLKYTALQPGGASEFLAVLDVDMIPTSNWLRSLLPHLLQSPRAAMVTPPQNYYNIPQDDRYDEGVFLIRHHDVVTALLDRSGNAVCSGTGFIARRKAIDSIGGFPTQSVAESVLTSWKLKADGWQNAYAPERVQWGLGPPTIQSYVRQCEKTAIGVASLIEHAAQPTGKEKRAVAQNASANLTLLLYTMPYWTSTLNMLLVSYVLVSGGLESRFSHTSRLPKTSTILALADFAAQLLYGSTISSLVQGRLHVLSHFSALWLAPHQLLALLFPQGLFKKGTSRQAQTYVPTNKPSEFEKKSFDTTLMRRVRSAFVKDLALIHFTVLSVCAISAGDWTFYVLKPLGRLNATSVIPRFIFSIGWPPFLLIWTAYIANAWTPVSCLLFPPVRPARESLLVQDSNAGAAYPSQKAKNNWYRRKRGWHLYIVTTYYVIFLLVLSVPDLAGTEPR